MRASYNRLKGPETYKLAQWLEANISSLEGMTRPQAAGIASAQLGFKVTPGNIEGVEVVTGLRMKKENLTPLQADMATIVEGIMHVALLIGGNVPLALHKLNERLNVQMSDELVGINSSNERYSPKTVSNFTIRTMSMVAYGVISTTQLASAYAKNGRKLSDPLDIDTAKKIWAEIAKIMEQETPRA